MSSQFQFSTLMPTEAAASTVPFCQIHYGAATNVSVSTGERTMEPGEKSSGDGPRNDSCLEGLWISGYYPQIANSSYDNSIFQQASMPSQVAGPVNPAQFIPPLILAQGAEGNVPATNPGLSPEHPEH
ncbi:hypothetical protein EDC04DRAFT_2597720 [Pisolithus marmoratus]|nr:hypothetical protein EDC04DRAFT_2597720 [Pisolithus marmoratus]